MGNIKSNQIKRRFSDADDSEKAQWERYCINKAITHTDEMLKNYVQLQNSRKGRYINSDLMKMVFDFYAKSRENRKEYNLSVTNSAAVLTNELYIRSIQKDDVKKCIFVVGPYGAGKSFFVQSLFEGEGDLLDGAVVYEGSITPPAFDEKVQLAIDNGVTPYIIALNPTLELSINNIKDRAKEIGRDVEKVEVLDKFSNFYKYMKGLTQKFEGINYLIYNKKSNTPLIENCYSKNLEDLNHGSIEEIEMEYDKIIKLINNRKSLNDVLKEGLRIGITIEETNNARNAERIAKQAIEGEKVIND